MNKLAECGYWHTRAVCKCGWHIRLIHGDLDHLTIRGVFGHVCPKCGQDKKDCMSVKVMRVIQTKIKDHWWSWTRTIEHWEVRGSDQVFPGMEVDRP